MATLLIEKYLKRKSDRPALEQTIIDKDLTPLYQRQQLIEQQIAPKK